MHTGTAADVPPSRWTFGVLGPVVALRDGTSIPLGGVKQRALLAFLILHANHPVSTRAIMRALWGDEPPPTAQKGIQVAVSRLRQAMGPEGKSVLVTTSNGYLLKAAVDSVDVRRAEGAATDARAVTDPGLAAQQVRAALALWRGTPLSDVADEPFAAAAAARLEDLLLELLDIRVTADLALGRHAQIVGELRALCQEHPLSEQLHEHLALALYRAGRQADGLETLREIRARLAEELGLDPTPVLDGLEERMLRHDPSLLPPTDGDRGTSSSAESQEQWRGIPRRRWPWALAGTAAVGVAVTLLVTLPGASTGHDSGPPSTLVKADSVVVLGGNGTDAVADVPVGSSPGAVAVTAHDIWVADASDHTVAQIDATSHRLMRTYGMSAAPVSLTPLGDKIWIGNAFAGTLSRILIPDQELSAPFFPQQQVAGLLAIAGAPDGLWVGLVDRTLLRLDPDNLRVTASITTPLRVQGIVSSGGSLWAIPFFGTEVDQIDPVRRTSSTLVGTRGHPNAIAAGGGSVWVTTGSPNALLRIDPRSGKVTSFPLDHAPSGLAVGADAVWVAEAGAGIVERFPIRGTLHSQINLGYRIGGITAAGPDVYVTLDDRM